MEVGITRLEYHRIKEVIEFARGMRGGLQNMACHGITKQVIHRIKCPCIMRMYILQPYPPEPLTRCWN